MEIRTERGIPELELTPQKLEDEHSKGTSYEGRVRPRRCDRVRRLSPTNGSSTSSLHARLRSSSRRRTLLIDSSHSPAEGTPSSHREKPNALTVPG